MFKIKELNVQEDVNDLIDMLDRLTPNNFPELSKRYALFYYQLFNEYQEYHGSFSILLALQTLPKELKYADFYGPDKKMFFIFPKSSLSKALKTRNKIKGQLLKIKFIIDNENR